MPQSGRVRKPLGEVVRTLRAHRSGSKRDGRPGPGQPGSGPSTFLPDGARFLDLRHACAAGAQRYRLYVTFIPVPTAKSSELWVQPYSITISPCRCWMIEGAQHA